MNKHRPKPRSVDAPVQMTNWDYRVYGGRPPMWVRCPICWQYFQDRREYRRHGNLTPQPDHLCTYERKDYRYRGVGEEPRIVTYPIYTHPFWHEKPASARFLRNGDRQKRKGRKSWRGSQSG